ncbi:hypothetical protein MESS2_560018 [Mesorhizobium metallidurans STM 2683]|uniref:Uncharacterized protein n=1 Tax=Mesorhizobium metallidurans STM 2683 TaxID=1297569 RepID=M5ETS2_9HYPH|nr:hypothetical protein MESS2_560018 [Mesorhizobium metallidurans STM 2683]
MHQLQGRRRQLLRVALAARKLQLKPGAAVMPRRVSFVQMHMAGYDSICPREALNC